MLQLILSSHLFGTRLASEHVCRSGIQHTPGRAGTFQDILQKRKEKGYVTGQGSSLSTSQYLALLVYTDQTLGSIGSNANGSNSFT